MWQKQYDWHVNVFKIMFWYWNWFICESGPETKKKVTILLITALLSFDVSLMTSLTKYWYKHDLVCVWYVLYVIWTMWDEVYAEPINRFTHTLMIVALKLWIVFLNSVSNKTVSIFLQNLKRLPAIKHPSSSLELPH